MDSDTAGIPNCVHHTIASSPPQAILRRQAYPIFRPMFRLPLSLPWVKQPDSSWPYRCSLLTILVTNLDRLYPWVCGNVRVCPPGRGYLGFSIPFRVVDRLPSVQVFVFTFHSRQGNVNPDSGICQTELLKTGPGRSM
jgi:hypothetical protein